MVRFGVSSVSNMTLCSKSDLGYPKLNLGYDYISDLGIPNRKFRFGKYEIEIPIWEYPKSYSEHKHVWATTDISNARATFPNTVTTLAYSLVTSQSKIVQNISGKAT
jgi:hypothetical protein